MDRKTPRNPRNENGFALVAAVLACLILLALGMLVISLSTRDLRTSAQTVGEKRALAAAETGVQRVLEHFDPSNLVTSQFETWRTADAANDPPSVYTVETVAEESGLPPVPLTGYSLEAGAWGMSRYTIQVTGQATAYGARVPLEIGVGYGPVPMGTLYR